MIKKVNTNNESKLISLIHEKQRRYTSRVVGAEDVKKLIIQAELKLNHLPKNNWKGIKLRLGYDYRKPNSYQYKMEASFIYLERGASSWFIIDLEREPTGNSDREVADIILPESLKDEFINRFFIKNSIKIGDIFFKLEVNNCSNK